VIRETLKQQVGRIVGRKVGQKVGWTVGQKVGRKVGRTVGRKQCQSLVMTVHILAKPPSLIQGCDIVVRPPKC